MNREEVRARFTSPDDRGYSPIRHAKSEVCCQLTLWRSNGQCPLWVKSRHLQCKTQCPLYPQKRTCAVQHECPLSATSGHSRGLIDYFIGAAEQRRRHGETEHSGGLRVDD